MASAMADATAWRCYAGDRRLVAVKQRVQEAPVAHPERVGAKSETRGATTTRVDVHGDHGGARIVGDGVPVTIVGKTTKQQWIKHHSIETKP